MQTLLRRSSVHLICTFLRRGQYWGSTFPRLRDLVDMATRAVTYFEFGMCMYKKLQQINKVFQQKPLVFTSGVDAAENEPVKDSGEQETNIINRY